MPEPIRYETKSDRELLIVVAETINALNEKTSKLCIQVEEHEKYIFEDRKELSSHDLRLKDIITDNAEATKLLSTTLDKVNSILTSYDKRILATETMAKFFWWIVAAIGAIITGVIVYILKYIRFPIG